MPRPMSYPPQLILGPELDPDQLPRNATPDQLADIHRKYFAPISPRSIRELWGLEWRLVNGRLVSGVTPFLAEAQRRYDTAPVVTSSQKVAA
jgi:hypothetical protein